MKTMCRVLDVSESGYYAWRKRELSQRHRENEWLTEQITQALSLLRFERVSKAEVYSPKSGQGSFIAW